MKKEIKILAINEGDTLVHTNGNRRFVEEYEWSGTVLERYMNVGYRIVNVIPDVTPAINQPGGYTFYKTGFTVFLEREVKPDNVYITEEDWKELNPMEEESEVGFDMDFEEEWEELPF